MKILGLSRISSWKSPIRFRPIVRALLLIVRSNPGEFWCMAVFNLAFSTGPAVLLWLGKVVIDQIASFGRATPLDWGLLTGKHATLLWGMLAIVVINLMLDSIETIAGFQLSSLRDRLAANSQQLLFSKISSFTGIEIFESSQLLNLITLAESSIIKLRYLVMVVYNQMTGAFILVATVILSASLAWWVPLLIFVFSIPSVYVQLDYQTRQWSVESAQAATVRKMNAHAEVLSKPAFAKDLRMYGLAPHFLQSWRTLFMAAFAEMRSIRRQGTTRTLGWSLLSGIGTGLPYVFVVLEALQGHLTVGDVALYAGLVFQVRRSLYALIANTTKLQEISLGANAFFELLDYEEPGKVNVALESEEGANSTINGAPGIELIDVSFTYPGTVHPTLRNINLSIAPGETLVIVGENGAGKTTLAKLLCRLYRPSAGKILLNNNDYSSMDIHAFRQKVAVVFQDFARFPATLRENIGFGRLSALSNDEAVLSAAAKGGLSDLITGLSQHLETPLSKQLEDGVELSGGQWQRVAIARALMRPTAQFVILDEPTAALDPHTEYEALEVFRQIAQKKTALIISHRLALARIATKIIVMERGQIIEQGTHDELMKAGQRYWSMFTRQTSSYLKSNASTE